MSETKAPGVGEVPPKPEGCAYGPWWDESDARWYCYCTHRSGFMLMRYRPDTESQKGCWLIWDARYRPECKQLLRVSDENAALRALVGEMGKQLSEQVKSTNTLAFWSKTNADDVRRYLPGIANSMLRQSNDAIDEMERSAALTVRAKEVTGK